MYIYIYDHIQYAQKLESQSWDAQHMRRIAKHGPRTDRFFKSCFSGSWREREKLEAIHILIWKTWNVRKINGIYGNESTLKPYETTGWRWLKVSTNHLIFGVPILTYRTYSHTLMFIHIEKWLIWIVWCSQFMHHPIRSNEDGTAVKTHATSGRLPQMEAHQ